MLREVQLRWLLMALLVLPCSSSQTSFNIQAGIPPVNVQRDQGKYRLSSIKMQQSHSPYELSALRFRGGSLSLEEEEDTETISKITIKVRNLIRSLLFIGEKKSPLAVTVLKSIVGWIEYLIGIPLLPSKKPSKLDQNKRVSKRGKADRETNPPKKRKSKSQSNNSTIQDTGLSRSRQGSSGHLKKKTVEKGKEGQGGKGKTRLDPVETGEESHKKRSNIGRSHLNTEIKSTNPNYRIQRELKDFLSSPPPNLSVKVGKNIRLWIITLSGAKNTIYEGESYRLRVQFPPEYPTVPPSVYFLQPTPRHEHVYTNGDICLSLLGKDWRPTMTAQSIAMSILSILSGAQRKSLPMDNARHAQNQPGQRQDNWVYHDDNC